MHQILDYRVETLFDPVQTHAAYRVPKLNVDALKAELKTKHGATRFRIVKSGIEGVVIVCFKLKVK